MVLKRGEKTLVRSSCSLCPATKGQHHLGQVCWALVSPSVKILMGLSFPI